MDNVPGQLFNGSTITPDIDAFFLQEQGGFLSQFFFAVSPKHPMMFLAVHDVMQRTWQPLLLCNWLNSLVHSWLNAPFCLCDPPNLQSVNDPRNAHLEMHGADDTGKIYIPFSTGPGSTKRAFLRFMGGTSKSPDAFNNKYGYPEAGTYVGKFGKDRSVTVVGSRRTGNNWVFRSALGRQKGKAWELMNITDYQQVNKQRSGLTCLMKLHEWHAEQRQKFVDEQLHRWRW